MALLIALLINIHVLTDDYGSRVELNIENIFNDEY